MLAGAKPPISGQGPGPKGREQGGVLGEGQPTRPPLPAIRKSGERCKLTQLGMGRSPGS